MSLFLIQHFLGVAPGSRRLCIAAALGVLSGLMYYLVVRIVPIDGADVTHGAYPSLVHMLSLTWLALALTGIRRGLLLSTLLLLVSIAGEYFVGYFTVLDTALLLVGYAAGAVSAAAYLRSTAVTEFPAGTTVAGSSLIMLSLIFIAGSDCCEEPRNAKPVYLSYQELRSNGVSVSEPRPLSDISRVYVYGDTIFLNNYNNGVHVIDNTNKLNPVNLGFIAIPGNTELSTRSNYLYADSYVDLITIDINDPENVFEIDREIDIFPYDAYQSIPDDVYFGYDGVDTLRGVVVGYEYLE